MNTPGNLEFGYVSVPLPTIDFASRVAVWLESHGFAYCLFGDTQNLAGDPYVASTLAAKSTSTIRVGTGVTNAVTRNAAVTASAIATVQVESNGRAILGLGRGDSSAASVGRKPSTTQEFEDYAKSIQTYHAGGTPLPGGLPMKWSSGLPHIPIDIACTGPKTIAMAARVADRVSLSVGAAPERVEWALGHAREAALESGRDLAQIEFGAYINLGVHRDTQEARDLVRTGVGLVAHFAGMNPAGISKLPVELREVAERLSSQYQMDQHGKSGGAQGKAFDDAFIDWFAIAGPPDHCISRLLDLQRLGISYVYLVSGTSDSTPLPLASSEDLMSDEVVSVLSSHLR